MPTYCPSTLIKPGDTNILYSIDACIEHESYVPLKNKNNNSRLYVPPNRTTGKLSSSQNAQDRQKQEWHSLRRNMNFIINKINENNIKELVVELFRLNLKWGRGLYCHCVMEAQSLSTHFTRVYAVLSAIINTKIPMVCRLLVVRLILQLKRALQSQDKRLATASILFLAHLTNYQVVYELLVFELLH